MVSVFCFSEIKGFPADGVYLFDSEHDAQMWVDDSQVCTIVAEKFFRSRYEQPHVEITVWQVGK